MTFLAKVKVFLDNSGVLSAKLSNLILTLLWGLCLPSFNSSFFLVFFSFFSLALFLLGSTPEYNCNKLAASESPFFVFLSKFFFLNLGDKNLDWSEGDAIFWGCSLGVELTGFFGLSAASE